MSGAPRHRPWPAARATAWRWTPSDLRAHRRKTRSLKRCGTDAIEQLAHFADREIGDDLLLRRARSASRSRRALESLSRSATARRQPSSGSSAASRSSGSGAKKLSASMATRRSRRGRCSAPGKHLGRIPDAAIARRTGVGSSASSSRSISFCMRSPESLREPRFFRRRGVQGVRVDLALAVPGMEAEQAQDAQIIFADARRRHRRRSARGRLSGLRRRRQ